MRRRATVVLLSAALLAEATAVIAQTAPRRDDPNRLICRRMPETGSLAATRRQCFTRAEWDRIAASQRAGAQQVVDGLSTRPGGN